jgi:trans-aconitate 2-methyltransferase
MSDWDGALYEQLNSLQQWVASRSLTGIELRGDERLLDVGCGDGHITAELARRLPDGTARGIDPSPRMIEVARKLDTGNERLRFEVQDVLAMRFAEDFDVVVSFNVLHWVLDQRRALERMHAALRPRGWALLQFVCGGPRASLESVAMEVCAAPRWRSSFEGFHAPFVHADPATVRDTATAVGFEVDDLSVEDLSWEFPTQADFSGWCRVGFSDWTSRLSDDALSDAFVADVVEAYSHVTGSARLFRFLQLRTVLRRVATRVAHEQK